MPQKLRLRGYNVRVESDYGMCLVKTGAPGCQKTSLKDKVVKTCNSSGFQPDLVILWAGLNDLKLKNGEGRGLESGLEEWLQTTQATCGDKAEVLLVPPHLIANAGQQLPELWPADDVPRMIETVSSAFSTASSKFSPAVHL